MPQALRLTTFDKVDISDSFFDSLKAQYTEFSNWFDRKSQKAEQVYVIDNSLKTAITGFLYLKIEDGPLDDIIPPLPAARRLKVGTLKVVARGTKLGERVIKKIFDHAISSEVEEVYVTVFDTHANLIRLLKTYGFLEIALKNTSNGQEIVLHRSMKLLTKNIVKDFPFIHTSDVSYWLLAIYPDYHSKLFPDSLLTSENAEIIDDVSFTNTIHKVYISKISLCRMKIGDIVVIYRTTDREGQARFRSVATSVCVVQETKRKSDFGSLADLVKYAASHSVFSPGEISSLYENDRLYTVKMTYNVALPKRPNRDALLDKVGISEQPRWDIRKLSFEHFKKITELGELKTNYIV